MPAETTQTLSRLSSLKSSLARRRLLVIGGSLAAAIALAACGGEESGKGSRDDPFPYSDPRSRNTRL